MKIVMMGTGPFAVPTFEALIASEHEVACLFTQPVRSVHRRKSSIPTPMRDVANAHGIAIHDPVSVNTQESRQLLADLQPDLLVVCDYGQILKDFILATATYGGINLHGSILPKYRGAAPVNWAILSGDEETGITVIHMTPKLDGGPCLKVVRTPIGPTETTVELEPRLADLGVSAVLESIEMLLKHGPEGTPGKVQDQSLATKAPRLAKSDADVNWNEPAELIYNKFRAYQPWPGCFTHLEHQGKPPLRIILKEIRLLREPAPEGISPGSVSQVAEDRLYFAAKDGQIVVDSLQPAGKKPMQVADFVHGHHPQVGDRLLSESQLSPQE
ncbi:Methionyl-tRNA formyltransferase [Bremerella volcania]|uniref:Methionyl-tRNA formyltransferase n=1 Tax=Bremerella volcania TaxID=2527984 RepID=A0A518CFX8_9BACT|nr:methionyl-tRNA formyltransferase [Bremerella volcania]QDU78117.1 Methionyl-tRNA formyltransferase [Bremerella volcania]